LLSPLAFSTLICGNIFYRHRCGCVKKELFPELTFVFQRTLACPYHCWNYSLDGKLIGTSLFNKARNEKYEKKDLSKLSLFDIKVDAWGPFVFANLDNDCLPLHSYLGDATQLYENYCYTRDEQGEKKPVEWVIKREKEYVVPSNWKNAIENFNDWYHVPWIHPSLAPVSTVSNHVVTQGKGMYMGFKTSPLTNGGTPADYDFLPVLSSLNAEQRTAAYFLTLFPNVVAFMMPHHLFILDCKPNGVSSTIERATLLLPKENLGKDQFEEEKMDKIMKYWDEVNNEDIEACVRVQKGQQSLMYTGGPFSQFEVMIHRFQKMLVEYLCAEQPQPDLSRFYCQKEADSCHEVNKMFSPAQFGSNF